MVLRKPSLKPAAALLAAAAFFFGTGAAFAIGPGEYALAARNGAGKLAFMEEHILTNSGGDRYHPRSYCGQTFYVSDYSERQMLKWVSAGYGVNLEHVTMGGKRQIVCRIQ